MEKLSRVFEKNLFWGVLGLSVFIPLYPKFPLLSVPGTYVAIRLEDFLIVAVVLWWGIGKLGRLKEFLNENITQAILLYWGIGVLSLFSALTITHTIAPHLGIFHYLRRVEFMILFFVAFSAFTSFRQIKLWLACMLAATIIVIIYGFGQQWLQFPVISTTNKEFSKGLILYLTPDARVNSTFAGHYDLAIYLSFFIILASSFFLFIKSWAKKIILACFCGFAFILLTMTAARVSFFAMMGGIASLFWFTNHKKLILTLILLGLFAFVISPELRHRTVATITVNLLGGGGPKYTPPPQKANPTKHFSIENAVTQSASYSAAPIDVVPGEPLNSTELGVYRSYGIRFDVEWPRAIRAFEKNPFLGTGYSSITIATDNDYLRTLGETGLLGVTALSLVFIIIIKRIWRYIRTSPKNESYYFMCGVSCSLLALFLNGMFIDVLESSKIAELLWLTLGASFATTKFKSYEN